MAAKTSLLQRIKFGKIKLLFGDIRHDAVKFGSEFET